MNISYVLLIIVCVVALGVLVLNIGAVRESPDVLLRWVCVSLFTFSMFRYLTLIVYGDSPSYNVLNTLRYFYFATSIGLTFPTAAAVWSITPAYREKISYPKYLLLFTPWAMFYLYVIIKQPTRIVVNKDFGYSLQLIDKFPLYLSIFQGSFIAIIVALCLFGLVKYKHPQLRSQYFALIVAQLLLSLDGLSYYFSALNVFPPFTITEVLGFLAVFYAFAKKRVEIKRKSST